MGLLVAGTYEKLLYGLGIIAGNQSETRLEQEQENSSQKNAVPHNNSKPTIKESFIFPAHLNSHSCLAACSRFLASGSSDEHINIYDLYLRKSIGSLMCHSSSITSLAFVGKSHLLSGDAEGGIAITRCSDWTTLRVLKGHVGAVSSIAAHSSGKVLLSVGVDGTVKCWDLARGLLCYSMRLSLAKTSGRRGSTVAGERRGVVWIQGEVYIVWCDYGFTIFNANNTKDSTDMALDGDQENSSSEKASIPITIQNETRISQILPMSVDGQILLIVVGESKKIAVHDSKGNKIADVETRHKLRIKACVQVECDWTDSPNKSQYISTVSSEGLLLIWDLNMLSKMLGAGDLDLDKSDECIVARYETKCRVTCLMYTLDPKEEKRQKKVMAKKESDAFHNMAAGYESSEVEGEMIGQVSRARVIVVDEDEETVIDTAVKQKTFKRKAKSVKKGQMKKTSKVSKKTGQS